MVEVTHEHGERYRHGDNTHAAREVYSCTKIGNIRYNGSIPRAENIRYYAPVPRTGNTYYYREVPRIPFNMNDFLINKETILHTHSLGFLSFFFMFYL